LEFKQDSYFLDGYAVIGRKMNEKGGLYEKRRWKGVEIFIILGHWVQLWIKVWCRRMDSGK
jgi:hypothetical protein